MINRQKIFCQGGEILSKVLKAISASGIRVYGIEESSGDAWYFGYSLCRGATSIGYDCGPDFFERNGYQKVDPYTFAVAWLGYIPESLRASAKGKVFCKGCPELEPILVTIRRKEDCGRFPFNIDSDPTYEFSQCTLDSTLAYNSSPYFGKKFGRIEVSPDVFAAIWLGTKTVADTKYTNADVPGPSKRSVTVTVSKFQIKL